MNIIIFGGAFDPVHNGHINMAISAQKALNGDVFFVPARISVWKNDSVPVEDKINMLRFAIKGKENLFIDEFEINSGKEINYSIDTVLYFKEKFPNDNLFLLIGTDQVNKFHLWKDAEKIAEVAKIIFFDRPDIEIQTENIEKYKILKIEGPGIVVSSSDIRKTVNFDIDPDVLLYIIEHKLYFVSGLTRYIDEHRLNHSISVAKLAYQIALANNLENPIKALIAGLLHDIGKTKDIPYLQKVVEEEYFDYKELPLPILHQFLSEKIAMEDFLITDKEILNAIKFHATGIDEMDTLAKIIYAADKIEPTRKFDSTELIEAMMVDVESGFKTVLQANKEYLEKSGKHFDNALTSNCFKKYL